MANGDPRIAPAASWTSWNPSCQAKSGVFCLKRACSFTVGIYNDVAMMFNNAYLFNVIYVYNYIYNNAVYIPGSLVFLP